MKKIFKAWPTPFSLLLPAFLVLGRMSVQAQVAINTDASQPNASAMLDVKSTNKGVLVPRMTTSQRTGIVSPAEGLWVFDTNTHSFWFFKTGTGWTEVTSGGGTGFALPFSATVNSGSPLFLLNNSGTGFALDGNSTGGSGIYGSTGTLSGAGLLADNLNAGEAVVGRTLSTGTPTGAVVGRNDGPGYGVFGFVATDQTGTGIGVLGQAGISGGKGIAGHFENLNATNASTALEAVTNGTGNGATIINSNSSNIANALNVTTNTQGDIPDHSFGNAGNFFNNNTNGVGAGVRGETNSIFGNNGTAGVYGTASGTGGYGGYFEHSNSSGFGYALEAITNGLGITANFVNTNAANTQPVISANTGGVGNVGYFLNTNSANLANTLNVVTNTNGDIPDHSLGNAGNFFNNNNFGVGAGVRGEVNSIFGNNGTAGVYGTSSGTGGYGGYFEHSNASGFGYALETITNGLGVGADFQTVNAANTQPTLQAGTNGTGNAGSFYNTNAANLANTLNVTTNTNGDIPDHSLGNAGNFFNNNNFGVGAGVRGEVNSIFGNNGTAGVYGTSSGTGGYGGYFEHSNSDGFGYASETITYGLGVGADFQTVNAANTQPTIQAGTSGTGNVVNLYSTNASNAANALNVNTNTNGYIYDRSQGNASNFFVNNNFAVSAAVRGEVNSIFGNEGTAGIYGVSSGTGGYAGYFEHTETTGFGITLQVVGFDQGTAMVVDQEGPNNIAIFQAQGADKARIDNTGKGFFNGGTQNSGADLAEAFDVEGNFSDYEAGDVLIISEVKDRTLVRSATAYSSLVAGVYATKPGVLLTEESLQGNLTGKVPLGVVGVIPTKVCDEGGPIHRGDILVTSSRPGYAMKADLHRLLPGQAIGKALENFEGAATGKIKVLVNVK